MIPRKEDFCLDFPRIVKDMGFTFSLWEGNVDWKKLDIIDVDHLIQECDLHTLHDNLTNIVNYRLENEMNFKPLTKDFIKIFKLAQLSVDYLMYSLQHLLNSVQLIREEYTACAKDRDFVVHELKKKEEETRVLKKKLKEKKGRMKLETPFPDHYVTPDYGYGGVYYKCDECPKAFVSAGHLRAHRLRRHISNPLVPGSGPCTHSACGAHTPCTHSTCPHATCAHTCLHALRDALLAHNPQNVNEEVEVVREDMAVSSLQPTTISSVPLVQSTTISQNATNCSLTSVGTTLPHTTSFPYSPPLGVPQHPTALLSAHESRTNFPRTLFQSENIIPSVQLLQSQMIGQSAIHPQQSTVNFLYPDTIISQSPVPSQQPTTVSSQPVPSQQPTTVSSQPVPSQQHTTISSEPVPSEQPTTISSEPVPSEQPTTLSSQSSISIVKPKISSPQPQMSPIPTHRPTTPVQLQIEPSLQHISFCDTSIPDIETQPSYEFKSPLIEHKGSELPHQSSFLDSDFTSVCLADVSLDSETNLQLSPVLSPSSSVPVLASTISCQLHSTTPTASSVVLHPPLLSQPQSVSFPVSMSRSVPSLPLRTTPPVSSALSLTQSHSPLKLQERSQQLPTPMPRARSKTQDLSRHSNISLQKQEPSMTKTKVASCRDDVCSSVTTAAIISIPVDDGMHDNTSSESDSQSLMTARPMLSTPVSKSHVLCKPQQLPDHTTRNDSPSSSSSQSSLCAHSPSNSPRQSLSLEMSHVQCSSSPPSTVTSELRAKLETLAADQLRRLGVGLGERLTDSTRASAQRQLEQRRRLLSKGYPGIMEKLRSCIERTVEEEVRNRSKSSDVTNLKKSLVF